MGLEETPLYTSPLPASVRMLSGVRGAVFVAGRTSLRNRGLLQAHDEFLGKAEQIALAAVTAAELVPMDLVHAYESAFERLQLSRDEARRIGIEISRAVNGVVYQTLARLAGKLGASPWLVFKQAPKTWGRVYEGGNVAVFRRGETTARVEVTGDPLARYQLHREALGGALLHVVEDYCKHPSMLELTDRRTDTSFSFTIRW